MKKVLLVPDSFKGTLSSGEVCRIMAQKIRECAPDCEIISLPVADGGEGSVDCFLTGGGEKVHMQAAGPFGEPVQAFYGILADGRTAVIEMAACAALPMVQGRENPERTTTYGVGQLMLNAAKRGCKKLILCLGGSCTNDMGAGAAAACGVRFTGADGKAFVPVGGTLQQVEHIDASGLSPLLQGVEITVLCDVDSPLYGETGAAFVFGPQKGANPAMVRRLDDGLKHTAKVVQKSLGMDISTLPGGGAAGGMGAGAAAFFGAKLEKGIEAVLNQFSFDELLCGADLVFTGEGRLDEQSLHGKVIDGVARRAAKQGVPVVVVAGEIRDPLGDAYQKGISAAFSINRRAMDFSKSRAFSAENLAYTMESILRLYLAASR